MLRRSFFRPCSTSSSSAKATTTSGISSATAAVQRHQQLNHDDAQQHHQSLTEINNRLDELKQAVHRCSDVLPHQGILKNFVHHNPLQVFENKHMFEEAQNIINEYERYSSPGERALALFGVDPRKRANEALSELCATFLDRGAAKWQAPDREKGFLFFFASLENLGGARWRKHARAEASKILGEFDHINPHEYRVDLSGLILERNLHEAFGVPLENKEERDLAIRSLMRELRGWAGMFSRMDMFSNEAPIGAKVRLLDFAAVQSILMRSSIEALIQDMAPGNSITSLPAWLSIAPSKEEAEEAKVEEQRRTTELHLHKFLSSPSSSESSSSSGGGGGAGGDDGPANELRRLFSLPSSISAKSTNKKKGEETRKKIITAADDPSPPPQPKTLDGMNNNNNNNTSTNNNNNNVITVTPYRSQIAAAQSVVDLDAKDATRESSIAFHDQTGIGRSNLETEFKHTLVTAIGTNPIVPSIDGPRPEFQFYTCLDDREGSLRRHIEEQNPTRYETFGVPGFFGLAVYYRPLDGREEMRLAPVGNYPSYVLEEKPAGETSTTPTTTTTTAKKSEKTFDGNNNDKASSSSSSSSFQERVWKKKTLAQMQVLFEKASFYPLVSLFVTCLVALPVSLPRFVLMCVAPEKLHQIKTYLLQDVAGIAPKPKTDFDLPMPEEVAAEKVAMLLKDIGTDKRLARVVTLIGHESSSSNNPFEAAYNCGACSGHSGAANARLCARIGNHRGIRKILADKFGVKIPDDTVFLGAVHNTCRDTVEFFDEESLLLNNNNTSSQVQQDISKVKEIISIALERNAFERCHRFMLAQHVKSPQEALDHVSRRAIDSAEVRPELNHSTNAAVVLGRRDLTKGKFLDRRVFLPSYDPFNDDEQGTNLEHMLAPALVVCSGINLEYLFSTIRAERYGAGTKAPLNIVGNIGVLQGTMGDLRTGLPTQMTEMHIPIRPLYLIDAPIARVEAVFARRHDLAQLVRNEWVRLAVRDPNTNQFFIHKKDGQYAQIFLDSEEKIVHAGETHVTFEPHREYAAHITRLETVAYAAAVAGMCCSCLVPVFYYNVLVVSPRAALVAICSSSVGACVITFARRYLHGEHMFVRFAALSTMLVLGFNLVATAPALSHVAVGGWSLFGFASTFLIGSYNDRPTVQRNSCYAFSAYRVGDVAMLVAVAFSPSAMAAVAASSPSGTASLLCVSPQAAPAIVAGALLVAALFKSSQFPFTAIFARSMEGPTPASALGYAGLAAHMPVVLLACTTELWFGFDWARLALASVGFMTSICSGMNAMIRSDRKGSIAYATSATVGMIFVVLAAGWTNTALIMSLGNATYRITQVLRAPSALSDAAALQADLRGAQPWHAQVPKSLYRFAWRVRRFDTDFHMLHHLMVLTSRFANHPLLNKKYTRWQQWLLTAVIVLLAGFPFTPLSDWWDHVLVKLFQTNPIVGVAAAIAHTTAAVVLVRLLLWKILDSRRFLDKRVSKWAKKF